MAEIPGHYRVSLELYLAGDLAGAVLHASHPLMEVLPAVYEDLLEFGLAEPMARALGRSASLVRERKPVEEINAAFEAATKTGIDAIESVAGDSSTSPSYSASVIAALLAAAARKYELSVADGRVVLPPEYQDAYGFIAQVQRMADSLQEAGVLADSTLAFDLAAVAGLVSGPKLPDEPPKDPTEVTAAIDLVRTRLEREAGALLRDTPTPIEALERIEYRLALLADILKHEETGRAEKLVARMYAEDYADLGPALAQADPEIDAELGPLLGRDLRLQLNRSEPPEAIATTVRRVIDLLEQAKSALGEE